MLLTLQDAILENGSYTWRFPNMEFVSYIISSDATKNVWCCMYQGTPNEQMSTAQPVFYPLLLPFRFQNDYYSILFTEDLATMPPILLTELTIELIPVPLHK